MHGVLLRWLHRVGGAASHGGYRDSTEAAEQARVAIELYAIGALNLLTSITFLSGYELQLPAEMGAWYSAVAFRRTLSGHLADG